MIKTTFFFVVLICALVFIVGCGSTEPTVENNYYTNTIYITTNIYTNGGMASGTTATWTLYYLDEGTTMSIIDFIGGGIVNIPSNIEGKPVTSIGFEAFERSYELKSVTIPNSVSNIGDNVFYNCYG